MADRENGPSIYVPGVYVPGAKRKLAAEGGPSAPTADTTGGQLHNPGATGKPYVPLPPPRPVRPFTPAGANANAPSTNGTHPMEPAGADGADLQDTRVDLKAVVTTSDEPTASTHHKGPLLLPPLPPTDPDGEPLHKPAPDKAERFDKPAETTPGTQTPPTRPENSLTEAQRVVIDNVLRVADEVSRFRHDLQHPDEASSSRLKTANERLTELQAIQTALRERWHLGRHNDLLAQVVGFVGYATKAIPDADVARTISVEQANALLETAQIAIDHTNFLPTQREHLTSELVIRQDAHQVMPRFWTQKRMLQEVHRVLADTNNEVTAIGRQETSGARSAASVLELVAQPDVSQPAPEAPIPLALVATSIRYADTPAGRHALKAYERDGDFDPEWPAAPLEPSAQPTTEPPATPETQPQVTTLAEAQAVLTDRLITALNILILDPSAHPDFADLQESITLQLGDTREGALRAVRASLPDIQLNEDVTDTAERVNNSIQDLAKAIAGQPKFSEWVNRARALQTDDRLPYLNSQITSTYVTQADRALANINLAEEALDIMPEAHRIILALSILGPGFDDKMPDDLIQQARTRLEEIAEPIRYNSLNTTVASLVESMPLDRPKLLEQLAAINTVANASTRLIVETSSINQRTIHALQALTSDEESSIMAAMPESLQNFMRAPLDADLIATIGRDSTTHRILENAAVTAFYSYAYAGETAEETQHVQEAMSRLADNMFDTARGREQATDGMPLDAFAQSALLLEYVSTLFGEQHEGMQYRVRPAVQDLFLNIFSNPASSDTPRVQAYRQLYDAQEALVRLRPRLTEQLSPTEAETPAPAENTLPVITDLGTASMRDLQRALSALSGYSNIPNAHNAGVWGMAREINHREIQNNEDDSAMASAFVAEAEAMVRAELRDRSSRSETICQLIDLGLRLGERIPEDARLGTLALPSGNIMIRPTETGVEVSQRNPQAGLRPGQIMSAESATSHPVADSAVANLFIPDRRVTPTDMQSALRFVTEIARMAGTVPPEYLIRIKESIAYARIPTREKLAMFAAVAPRMPELGALDTYKGLALAGREPGQLTYNTPLDVVRSAILDHESTALPLIDQNLTQQDATGLMGITEVGERLAQDPAMITILKHEAEGLPSSYDVVFYVNSPQGVIRGETITVNDQGVNITAPTPEPESGTFWGEQPEEAAETPASVAPAPESPTALESTVAIAPVIRKGLWNRLTQAGPVGALRRNLEARPPTAADYQATALHHQQWVLYNVSAALGRDLKSLTDVTRAEITALHSFQPAQDLAHALVADAQGVMQVEITRPDKGHITFGDLVETYQAVHHISLASLREELTSGNRLEMPAGYYQADMAARRTQNNTPRRPRMPFTFAAIGQELLGMAHDILLWTPTTVEHGEEFPPRS